MGDMEDMLMNDDDSSSDSDNEVEEVTGPATVPPTAAPGSIPSPIPVPLTTPTTATLPTNAKRTLNSVGTDAGTRTGATIVSASAPSSFIAAPPAMHTNINTSTNNAPVSLNTNVNVPAPASISASKPYTHAHSHHTHTQHAHTRHSFPTPSSMPLASSSAPRPAPTSVSAGTSINTNPVPLPITTQRSTPMTVQQQNNAKLKSLYNSSKNTPRTSMNTAHPVHPTNSSRAAHPSQHSSHPTHSTRPTSNMNNLQQQSSTARSTMPQTYKPQQQQLMNTHISTNVNVNGHPQRQHSNSHSSHTSHNTHSSHSAHNTHSNHNVQHNQHGAFQPTSMAAMSGNNPPTSSSVISSQQHQQQQQQQQLTNQSSVPSLEHNTHKRRRGALPMNSSVQNDNIMSPNPVSVSTHHPSHSSHPSHTSHPSRTSHTSHVSHSHPSHVSHSQRASTITKSSTTQHPSTSTQHYLHSTPSSQSAQTKQQQQQVKGQRASSSSQIISHQQEQKSRKEQFLMFTKVLMKYLEARDGEKHQRAKQVIRECAKKNKDGVSGYQSLSASMQKHLRKEVGEQYWKKAEEYLAQYLCEQYKKKNVPAQEAKKKAEAVAKKAAENLPNPAMYPNPQQLRQSAPQPTQSAPQPQPALQPVQPTQPTQPPLKIPSTVSSIQETSISKPKTQKSSSTKQPSSKGKSTKGGKRKEKKQPKTPTIIGGVPSSSSSVGSTKTKKTPKRKIGSDASNRSLGTAEFNHPSTYTPSTSPVKRTQASSSSGPPPESLKEFSEFMQMVHHVVDYDASIFALIFNDKKSSSASMVNITDEQRKLLYGTSNIKGISTNISANVTSGSSVPDRTSSSTTADGENDDNSSLPSHFKGWGDRNIMSSRTAWAKLRLLEQEDTKVSVLKLPNPLQQQHTTNSIAGATLKQDKILHKDSWFNEEKAEKDETLALISEATQQYLKTILEAAIKSTRQRLNLDGIRLWHQQLAAAVAKESPSKSIPPQLINDPPLHLRLGCDVRRQCAMAEGNAAKTCQRMEEALSRLENADDDVDGV
jgi:hypothetical protein